MRNILTNLCTNGNFITYNSLYRFNIRKWHKEGNLRRFWFHGPDNISRQLNCLALGSWIQFPITSNKWLPFEQFSLSTTL